jgi:hypothetical protein
MASPTSAGSRYIFQINPGTGGNNNLTRRNYKRQSTPVYLNPDGSYDSSSCSSASIFTLSNGKLELDGQVVSTDPGIPFQPLTSSFVVLGISRNFVLVNVILVWQSGAFTGNAAIFCQVASGQAYVEFDGPPKPAYPPNCIVITLIAVPSMSHFHLKLTR